ncbi:MAG: hypothetical protein ACE5IK_13825 [Acidobacteriota bacterium]
MSFKSIRPVAVIAAAARMLGGLITAPARATAEINSAPVLEFATGARLDGSAMLVRSEAGVTFTLHVGEGIAAHAPVTVWMVVWNNPENCDRLGGALPFCNDTDFNQEFDGNPATNVNVAVLGPIAGHVVGPNGKANFAGHLNVGDASGSINGLFGLPFTGGLIDPFGAEVHLIVHVHPTDLGDGTVANAIHSFDGGCPGGVGCEDVSFAFFPKP